MGCCNSKLDHQNRHEELMPHEEYMIEKSEGFEIYASLKQMMNIIQLDPTELQGNLSQILETLPAQAISGFENSPFKFLVAVALTNPGQPEQRAISILNLYNKHVFSYEDLDKLVEDLIEIAARILPFMVYKAKGLNEYSFHYYISSLAKGKQAFRRSCLFDIIGNEAEIDKTTLLGKLKTSPLMMTHVTRVEIWKLRNKRKSSGDDLTIQSSLTPRTMHRASFDNIF